MPAAAGGDDLAKPESLRADPETEAVYDQLYALYRELHDSFGGLNKSADLSQVMKTLLDIKYAHGHCIRRNRA